MLQHPLVRPRYPGGSRRQLSAHHSAHALRAVIPAALLHWLGPHPAACHSRGCRPLHRIACDLSGLQARSHLWWCRLQVCRGSCCSSWRCYLCCSLLCLLDLIGRQLLEARCWLERGLAAVLQLQLRQGCCQRHDGSRQVRGPTPWGVQGCGFPPRYIVMLVWQVIVGRWLLCALPHPRDMPVALCMSICGHCLRLAT